MLTRISILITIIALLVSCSKIKSIFEPDPIEITGQIFIVTKGAGTYKLSLVEVSAVEADTFIAKYQESLPIMNGVYESLCSLGVKQAALTDSANASFNYRSERWFTSMKMMSGENPQMKEAMKDMTPEQQQIMKNMMSKDECERLFAEYKTTLKDIRNYENGLMWYDASIPAFSRSKSDADGNFKLSLVPGKTYVLTAMASREISKDVEYYVWILYYVTPKKQEHTLLLSNDNMFDSQNPSSAIIKNQDNKFELRHLMQNGSNNGNR